MRSYEIWGTGDVDQAIYKRVIKMLTQLCDFIYAPSEESSDADPPDVRDSKIAAYRQVGTPKSARVSTLSILPNGATLSQPPSEVFSGQPNKHHQSLLRNMGMAREVYVS